MKKTLLFLIIVSFVFAVDMSGKIGFGIGTTRFGDLLKPSLFAMRYGITPKIVLEPWLDITQVSWEVKSPEEATTTFTISNKGLGIQGLFTLKDAEKSNLYGIGGVTFGMAELKSAITYDEEDKYTVKTSGTYVIIPLGIGGEYFLIQDHFSINLNAKFGLAFLSGELKTIYQNITETVGESKLSAFNIGNSLFTLYFMWYF